MALGNLMGSSIANILGCFSLGLLFIRSATFDRSSKIYAVVLMALTTFLLACLVIPGEALKRMAGVFLMGCFMLYIVSVASLIYGGTLSAPENDSDDSSDDDSSDRSDSDAGSDGEERGQRSSKPSLAYGHKADFSTKNAARKVRSSRVARPNKGRRPNPLRFHALHLVIGFGALVISSYIIAHTAGAIGHELSLSDSVVGTTILSIATSLPEKFVAVLGGVRKQPGIMVANTVGSNIFLITLCAGVLFVWGDADQLASSFTVFEASAMWVSAAVLLAIVLSGGRSWMGALLLCCYLSFLLYEFVNGRTLDDD